ncbi:glycosyltransferase [Candidatus Marsarchaeota archaeon]|nr:glycosyltransferase [Candidatus Marsarchaeota archaeon]
MRIAFVYDVPYPWHVGGIESMNFNEAVELAKAHEVHFFTTRWGGMKSNDFTYHGIHYHAFHTTGQGRIYRHGRRSIREALAFSSSVKQLFKYDFDVVITNVFPILHLPLVKRYCRLKHAKLIMEVAEVWDRKYWRKYLGPILGDLAYSYSRGAILGADFYITISSDTSKRLAAFGVDKSSMLVFAPSLDNGKIDKICRERISRSKRVIFSGRMIKEKRLDIWLHLFSEAHRIDSSLKGLIIGNGPERSELEGMIKDLDLGGSIDMPDFYASSSELYRKIRGSSAVLHMSEREGLGIIAIESIALGTPVILPKDTPIPKEVREMCVVADEKSIPRKIVEIANSKNPQKYVFNKKNLSIYSKSEVRTFYKTLFSSLGLRG